MTALMPPQTVLTAADAANQLQAKGLDALGLVVPTLSSAWSSTAPVSADYAEADLRLTIDRPLAPFRGALHYETSPSVFSNVTGGPITGAVAVLKMHPEASRRLELLAAERLGRPQVRPLPTAMLVHNVTAPASARPVAWFQAGEALPASGRLPISFHDRRGLPVDPLAVAALFQELLSWRPALRLGPTSMPLGTAPGGLAAFVALATAAVRCHVVDPHGNAYTPIRALGRLKVIDAGGAEVAPVADGGLLALAVGQRLGRSSADDSSDATADAGTPLQWGWGRNATLGRTSLSPPPLPAGVTLGTQFFRVTAVDLDWHLLGNRTAGTVADIPGDDDTVPDFALPVVRPAVPSFDYLVDGMDVLGAAGEMATSFPPPGASARLLLASASIDSGVTVPPGPGASGHWPAFPSTTAGAPSLATSNAVAGISATFRSPADGPAARLDVVLTIAADVVPEGTHLRVYPRRFQEIRSIGETPSFVRADGGSGLAAAGQPTRILLVNPFVLAGADPLPLPAVLSVDVVATGRSGQRRLHSQVDLTVDPTPTSFADDGSRFGGTALLTSAALSPLLTGVGATAAAPASLFGIPPASAPAGGAVTDVVDLVRRLASETTAPRLGPRLPTQARFETVLALGAAPAAGHPLAWRALLTGARWDIETRSARPELGDPGNPAGPDLHAAGVRADGQLGRDLALHALKRAQPIFPLPPSTPGWFVTLADDGWAEPSADVSGSVAAALLETVAPFCDSPELAISALPVPQPGDTIQGVVDSLAGALGVPAPPVSPASESRLRRALQREMIAAKHGQRDALWALRRALGQAREFVYIEGPAFAQTARAPTTSRAHEIDLVETLRARLQANPRLKVMICVPRLPDFLPSKENWVRAALAHRKQAVQTLTAQDRQRVAAFHPIGFPGRPSVIRSTVVIVDDVWAMVGTSHLRRRGMTFDGAADVVSIDRSLDSRGTSSAIARFRQELMASKLGVAMPTGPGDGSALWTRLAEPEAAFDALADSWQPVA